MNYNESLAWLEKSTALGIKLGLDIPKKLVSMMNGMPDEGSQVIHIAGTNGKGSTSVFIESILRSHGAKVGLFTSPHLVDLNERFQINRKAISNDELAAALTQLRECAEVIEKEEGHHPTFFEMGVAVAMHWFLKEKVDYIILETGMGGRLDATSVVPSAYQVITPIGMDHQEYLGDTLEAIAAEKAGIVRKRAKVCFARQESCVETVIREHITSQEAKEVSLEVLDENLKTGIKGQHQKENAAVAYSLAQEILGDQFKKEKAYAAIEQARWNARFQEIEVASYKGVKLSMDKKIILDGAHNEQSIAAFLSTWKSHFGNQKAQVVFGALRDKNAEDSLLSLLEIASEVHLVPIDNPRAMKPHELQKALPEPYRLSSVIHPTVESVFELNLLRENNEQIMVIIGSLYLAGEVLRALSIPEPNQ